MNSKLQLFEVPQIESVQDMLLKSADRYANKIALEDLTNYPIPKVTYSELIKYIMKFGSALQKLGIKPRDHVAVIGENRVQWAIAYLTAMMFDFVVVPVDRNLTHSDILNIIHDSDSTALIFSGSLLELFRDKKDALIKIKYFINMDSRKKEHDFYERASNTTRDYGDTRNRQSIYRNAHSTNTSSRTPASRSRQNTRGSSATTR